jgi:hypothetical protein
MPIVFHGAPQFLVKKQGLMKGCEGGFGAFAASRIVFRQYSRRFRTPLLSYSKIFAGVTINYGFGLRLFERSGTESDY